MIKESEIPNPVVETVKKVNGHQHTKKYRRVALIGKGGFAQCFEVLESESQRRMALKVLQKGLISRHKIKDKILSELKLHKSLHNQFIVEIDHVFEDQNFIYILLQLCENRSIADMLKSRSSVSELEARFLLRGVLLGLQHIHQQHIIHRDIKAGNIFLADGLVPKIGDFGLAIKLEFAGQRKRTICGTPNYIAPEIINGEGYSYEVDIWSVGIILYFALFGKPPFQGQDVKSTYRRIRACDLRFSERRELLQSSFALIKTILVLDPLNRPTIKQILAHPFFTKFQYDIPAFLPNQASIRKPLLKLEKQDKSTTIERTRLDLTQLKKQEAVATAAKRVCSQSPQYSPRALSPRVAAQPTNQIFVFRYIDASDKFGFGFQLSNGVYGAYFLDNVVLAVDQKYQIITLVDRKDAQKVNTFPIAEFPETKDNVKRLKLVRSFVSSFGEQKGSRQGRTMDGSKRGVFMKQFLKFKDATVFRLSNGVVQTVFASKQELILETVQKRVRFWSEMGKYSTCLVRDIEEDTNLHDAYTYTTWVAKQHRMLK